MTKLSKHLFYLGLSALALITFVSKNVHADNNYNFAPKPNTSFVTTNYHLDQSLVFRANGQNAIYSQPGTTKGANMLVAQNDMLKKSNNNKISDYFMAYQEAVTNKGLHYYKVVSFDKKIRGYIYVDGIDTITSNHNAEVPMNPNGYLHSTRLFNYAYGAQFGATIKHFNGMNYNDDLFNIDHSVQVLNGNQYYHVVDTKAPVINGWINAKYFSINK